MPATLREQIMDELTDRRMSAAELSAELGAHIEAVVLELQALIADRMVCEGRRSRHESTPIYDMIRTRKAA